MKRNRKNINQIRIGIINYFLNSDKLGNTAVTTHTLEKALNSNNLTTRAHLDWWSKQTIIFPIKIEDRIVGWELNTDLLGMLLATDLEDLDFTKKFKKQMLVEK